MLSNYIKWVCALLSIRFHTVTLVFEPRSRSYYPLLRKKLTFIFKYKNLQWDGLSTSLRSLKSTSITYGHPAHIFSYRQSNLLTIILLLERWFNMLMIYKTSRLITNFISTPLCASRHTALEDINATRNHELRTNPCKESRINFTSCEELNPWSPCNYWPSFQSPPY